MRIKLDTTKQVSRKGNRYCGPLVMAAITDASTGECEAVIMDANPRRAYRNTTWRGNRVKWMHNPELQAALRALGYRCEWQSARLTRYRFAGLMYSAHSVDAFGDLTVSEPYSMLRRTQTATTLRKFAQTLDPTLTVVIQLPTHYVLVHDGKLVDTHTDGKWIPLADAPHQRAHVHNFLVVEM